MTPQTVYLIRHGQVDGNVLQLGRRVTIAEFNAMVEQVPYESINEAGIAQVKAIIPHIARCNLSLLYTSPLLRARQTARILAEATGLPVRVRHDLYELQPARLPGPPDRSYTLRGAYFRSGLRLANPFTRDTETVLRAFQRVRRAWQEMIRETQADFGIVGHQGVFRMLFLWIHLSPRWRLVKGDTRNTGISIIQRRSGHP